MKENMKEDKGSNKLACMCVSLKGLKKKNKTRNTVKKKIQSTLM